MNQDLARRELDQLITRSGTSYAAISRLIGRNAAYIQQYIKRRTPEQLEERDRRLIADFFGIDETLLGPSSFMALRQQTMLAVPRLDVQASAGPGAAVGNEMALSHYWFDYGWLRQISQGQPESLSIVQVRGDSMAPTLADGDDILVVPIDGNMTLQDGIYVLQRDEALLVKRLALSPSAGTLTIASDNPVYPSWTDCAINDVRIAGRVVWAGRKLS